MGEVKVLQKAFPQWSGEGFEQRGDWRAWRGQGHCANSTEQEESRWKEGVKKMYLGIEIEILRKRGTEPGAKTPDQPNTNGSFSVGQ